MNRHSATPDQIHRPGNSGRVHSVSQVARDSHSQAMNPDDAEPQLKGYGHSSKANEPVFVDEISSTAGESSAKDVGVLDNCGILPSNCLPCLASTMNSVEKRKSPSSSPPSGLKKAALKLSFKWKEGNPNAALCECSRSICFMFCLTGLVFDNCILPSSCTLHVNCNWPTTSRYCHFFSIPFLTSPQGFKTRLQEMLRSPLC